MTNQEIKIEQVRSGDTVEIQLTGSSANELFAITVDDIYYTPPADSYRIMSEKFEVRVCASDVSRVTLLNREDFSGTVWDDEDKSPRRLHREGGYGPTILVWSPEHSLWEKYSHDMYTPTYQSLEKLKTQTLSFLED